MANKDYYSILGLSESDKQLRGKEFNDKLSKEFRKLSLKWHPDKWVNGTDEEKKTAEEKFKEISEAYSVLSDEKQRDKYDNGGVGFDPFSGQDPWADIKRHFQGASFGPFSFQFGDPFSQQQTGPTPINGSNVLVDVVITLKEACDGCTKTVTYQREQTCSHCNGTGSEDGKVHNCPHCNGVGKIERTTKSTQNMRSFVIVDCPYCNGTGKEPNEKCHVCQGIGTRTITETKDIPVPKGVDNGSVIGYQGLGNPGKNGGATGALEVRFTIKDDPYFERDGSELIHLEDVPFNEALLGCNITVKTIDGNEIKLKLPELTPSGTIYKYDGLGMPSLDRYGRNGPRGAYSVIIRHKLPNKLSKKQKDALKLFGEEKW